MLRFIFLCALLAYSSSLFAEQLLVQFIDPIDGKIDASSYLAENAYGFLPVPIVITDPALEGGLGMIGLFFHESEEDAQKRKEAMRSSENAAKHLLPPSVSAVASAYTGNNSWFTGGGHVGFFKQGHIRYMGGLGYGDINLNFYGFGNLAFNRPLELNTQAIGVMQNVKFKLPKSNVFIGIKQTYVNAEISPTRLPDFGILLPPEWQQPIEDAITRLLTSQVTTSGIGASFEYDNRDNFFSPRQGYRYTFDYTRFDDFIGSDIEYDLFEFQGLNYWPINDTWQTALRFVAEHTNTDTFLPPYALPSLKLRGVPIGRYQGDYVAAGELEVNYQLDKRWTLSGFAGIGRVSSDFETMKSGNSQIAKGVGFRYLIARRYGFKMGVDVAFGPEETVWYIQAGSAW